jgi:hypothetical protein
MHAGTRVSPHEFTVSYDRGYEDADRSLEAVTCSNGANGVIDRWGWSKQGDIPDFPNIGGAYVVNGWNSTGCGTCWKLEYDGNSVNILAIDLAVEGFNIALIAMNTLTGGQAEALGRIDATSTEVDLSECGIED